MQGVGEPGKALGAAEFAALLVAAGADARWATPAWTANHFRWVVWKLAALERRHDRALAGRALTAPVVLDQLKYRCGRTASVHHPKVTWFDYAGVSDDVGADRFLAGVSPPT